MKYLLFILVSTMVGTVFSQAFENFNYLGAVNANGWVTHSGATPGQIQTISTPSNSGNSLAFANLEASVGNRVQITAGNTEDVNKAAANLVGSAYFSFLLNVPNTTGLHINANAGDYFMGFGATAGTPVTSLGARVFIKAGVTPSTFVLGLTNNSGTGTNTTWNPTEYACGTTVFVVVKLNTTVTPIAASMWINPVPGSAEPTATILNNSGVNPLAALASIFIRQGGTAVTGTGTLEIDEIRVGSTWTAVTPCATPTLYYQDLDLDTFGDPNTSVSSCLPLPGLVLNNQDCNDNNAAINPNSIWYADADLDGFGNPNVSLTTCVCPLGYVANNTDCNDNNALANVITTWYADTDGDGYGNPNTSIQNCGQPVNYVSNNTDCNDAAAAINPAAVEVYNGIDDNCNNSVDEGFNPINYYLDNDGDGVGGIIVVVGITSPGPNYVLVTGDCDDNNALAIAVSTWYADTDGDGYGNASSSVQNCGQPVNYVSNNTDCNDLVATINPAAPEVFNGIDDNCNNTVDEGFTPNNYYLDNDGDGVGGNTVVVGITSPGPNYVLITGDCDDNNPLATAITTWYADTDGDGYGNPTSSIQNCGQPANYVSNNTDCNDAAAAINPAAVEVYNGIDDNCNNSIDEGFNPINYYLDNDADGIGGNTVVVGITSPGPNYVLVTGDCNDNNAAMFPGNTEICDNIDNDCDASVDEGLIFLTYYQDFDGDTYGNLSVSLVSCSSPLGYVLDSTDCNDLVSGINPGAIDVPGNGIDEDCSGLDSPLLPSQLGLYQFTQAAVCPVTADTVNVQPANATFSIYTNQGGTCVATANVFNNNTWNTGAIVDPNNYNEFTIQPDSCYGLSLTQLTFTHKVSNVNTIPVWHLRSSLDNFAADVAYDTIPSNLFLNDTVQLGAAFQNIGAVTFRFYITGISTPNATWRNDNVSVWGFINPTAPQTYYADVDSDGFGDLNSTVIACSAPQGYTTNNTDCDDNNALINPNTIWYVDADQDGYGDPNNFTTSCLTPPGAVLNGDDCDDTNAQLALVAMYYVDADGDGFGDDATGVEQCSQPANTVTVGGDCNDLNDQSYPGAVEICDNEDNNCDGNSDEGLPLITYYEDLDNDDFGSANTLESCDSLGAGYSLTTGDCDDANDQVYPGATEVIDNGIDENCDGVDNYLGLVSMDNWIIELVPNPSTGSFQINCGLAIFDVVVTDITGKVLYTQNDQHVENMISTQPWAPATYFVTVRYNGQSKVERLQVR